MDTRHKYNPKYMIKKIAIIFIVHMAPCLIIIPLWYENVNTIISILLTLFVIKSCVESLSKSLLSYSSILNKKTQKLNKIYDGIKDIIPEKDKNIFN